MVKFWFKGGKYRRGGEDFNILIRLRFAGLAGRWGMLRWLIFLLFATAASAEPETKRPVPWPKGYDGKQHLEVKKLEGLEDGQFGYESEGFRFVADSKISDRDWRSIMVVCEGLRGAVRSLPLGIMAEADRRKAEVRIFATEEDYHVAGGMGGTVGTYWSRSSEVLVWSRGLIEPDPERGTFRLPKAKEYDLLVHELSHQVTDGEFRRLPVWFSEGFAEYLAAAHYSPGKYSFKDPSVSMKAHVTKYLGALAKKDGFAIVPLRTITQLSTRAWAENTRNGEGHGPYLKYISASLLFHYFCHLDPKVKDGEAIRDFLDALRSGEPASKATVEQLLRGRSFDQIETEIEKYWRGRGLRFEFRQ